MRSEVTVNDCKAVDGCKAQVGIVTEKSPLVGGDV